MDTVCASTGQFGMLMVLLGVVVGGMGGVIGGLLLDRRDLLTGRPLPPTRLPAICRVMLDELLIE